MWQIDKTIPLSARRWIYGVATAVIPLLIAYGVVDDQTAPLWVALVAAVLVPGMATAATVPSNASVVVEPSDDPQPEAVEDGPAVIDEEAAPRRAADPDVDDLA